MKLKEWSSTNLIKQLNTRNFFNLLEKNVVKNNDQHPLFPTVNTNHRGEGETNSEIIYLQNEQTIDGENIYNLYLIICDYEINSFDTISTFQRMKWKDKSSIKLLKQWNEGKKIEIM